jgi:hypothetical protein
MEGRQNVMLMMLRRHLVEGIVSSAWSCVIVHYGQLGWGQ